MAKIAIRFEVEPVTDTPTLWQRWAVRLLAGIVSLCFQGICLVMGATYGLLPMSHYRVKDWLEHGLKPPET